MNWRRVIEIARWEYLQKVRAKSFIFSLILTPLIITLSGVIPALVATDEPDTTTMLGLVDQSDSLFAPLKAWLDRNERLSNGAPAFLVANFDGRGNLDAAITRADSAVLQGKIEGVAVVKDIGDSLSVEYRSENPGNIHALSAVRQALNEIIRARRLSAAGIDTALFARLSPKINLNTVKVTHPGEAGALDFEAMFFTAYFVSFLLMLLVMTTGGTLVRSLVEEKSNRIMEILVSSGTPLELMWGKLIGLGALGITQVLAWIVMGIAIASSAAMSSTILAQLSRIFEVLPLMVIYLVLGYTFYSSIFIGLGSLVTTEQEAQMVTSWLVILILVPMMISVGVISNPDAAYIRGLSLVPFFTPSLMMLRLVTKMPPVTEILGTILLMMASTVLVAWVCARIFRTAILMYGKRPTAREIVRWLRAPSGAP